jgi:hypothetical protein
MQVYEALSEGLTGVNSLLALQGLNPGKFDLLQVIDCNAKRDQCLENLCHVTFADLVHKCSIRRVL